MIETVGIRFKEGGKVYDFDADGNKFNKGDYAVVETVRGLECGLVARANRGLPEDDIVKPLKRLSVLHLPTILKDWKKTRLRKKKLLKYVRKKSKSTGLK